MKKETYASAGVNINVATGVKQVIARQVQSTYGPQVLSGAGFFGSLYDTAAAYAKNLLPLSN